MSVHSTDSGSPVDEDVFLKVGNSTLTLDDLSRHSLAFCFTVLQLKLGQVVENYEYEILEAAVSTVDTV